MATISRYALPLLAALCLACSGSPVLPSAELIEAFVQSEQLLNAQPARITLDLPQFQARIFTVTFGPVTACQPMVGGPPNRGPCYSAHAIGFEYQGRVGWLEGAPGNEGLPTPFAFHAKDHELFGAPIATALRDANHGAYAQAYTPALLRESMTPRTTLLRLAQELDTWIAPYNANLLLRRNDVRGDAEILRVVAGVAVTQGDAYVGYRREAQRLLDSLSAR